MTPIYWAFDHALHLYPLPDLIVVCDKFKSITDTIADCTIINPVSKIKIRNYLNFLCLIRVHLQSINIVSKCIYLQLVKLKIVRLLICKLQFR